MTAKEIDALAKKRLTLPTGANITECGLYFVLMGIYGAYDIGSKTADEAKQEKQAAIEEFEHLTALQKENEELSRRISQHIEIFKRDDTQRVILSPLLSQANKNDCALCREIARVYDGRK